MGPACWPVAVLFPRPWIFYELDHCQLQRSRIHKEAADRCGTFYRILCRKYNRAADVQGLGEARLPERVHCVSGEIVNKLVDFLIQSRMLVGYCIKLLMVLVLYAYMWSENKKRDRESASGIHLTDEEEKAAVEAGMLDVTEIDNKGFRYIL